jgi:hypothetical protein
VFLLSRVAEARRRGASEGAALVTGVGRSGRVITSAASIMVVVFGAFALGDFVLMKIMGVALAAAVVLDATLVRLAVGPAPRARRPLELVARLTRTPSRDFTHDQPTCKSSSCRGVEQLNGRGAAERRSGILQLIDAEAADNSRRTRRTWKGCGETKASMPTPSSAIGGCGWRGIVRRLTERDPENSAPRPRRSSARSASISCTHFRVDRLQRPNAARPRPGAKGQSSASTGGTGPRVWAVRAPSRPPAASRAASE